MKSLIRTALLTTLLIACTCRQVHAITETITLKGGQIHNGTFESFKADRFYFQPKDANKINERSIRVESLNLDPPAKVIVKPRGSTPIEGLKLIKYEKSQFLFDDNGKQILMPASKINSINTVLDLNREMHRTDENTDAANSPTNNKIHDVSAYVKTGMITVIHFHMDSVMSSVRQGSYLKSLAQEKNNKKNTHVVKISFTDNNSPSLKKYGITSIPQFWFYNRNGNLVEKLIGRFTDEDICSAFEKAKKR